VWDILVNQWFPRGEEDGGPVAKLPDGTEVLAFPTATGDGLYSDHDGNQYMVDGGTIGLVPVTEITTAALEAEQEDSRQHGVTRPLMQRVSFDEPARCYVAGKIDGPLMDGDREAVLVFGDHHIWT
jgi:hypothetical protein